MAAESSSNKKSRRLSGEPALHDDHFPPLSKFHPPDKLPSLASIIGRVRMLSGGGKKNLSTDKAVLEVAKEVESKYFHDTVLCHSKSKIAKDIKELLITYKEGGEICAGW